MPQTSAAIPTYVLPGPKGKAVVDRETARLTTGTKTAPVVVKSAKGLLVEDVDGNVFLDFTNGMVAATGHAHPKRPQPSPNKPNAGSSSIVPISIRRFKPR